MICNFVVEKQVNLYTSNETPRQLFFTIDRGRVVSGYKPKDDDEYIKIIGFGRDYLVERKKLYLVSPHLGVPETETPSYFSFFITMDQKLWTSIARIHQPYNPKRASNLGTSYLYNDHIFVHTRYNKHVVWRVYAPMTPQIEELI